MDNQEARVLNYLKENGHITPMEAWNELGITKLATVVSKLIYKRGHNIKKTMCKGVNRFGEPCCFMKYSLAEDKQ